MIQLSAEVTPHRDPMPRRPPRRKDHVHQEGDSQDASGAYPESEQQRKANEQFDDADDIAKENPMRQDESGQDRPVETHRAVRDVILQIGLKSAMRELGPNNLVLAE